MKTTTFIAILLTFLTLLLVLVAAVIFFWQGRGENLAQIERLEGEQSALQGTATVVRSYLTAREEGLATARAAGTASAQALGRVEATAEALEATRADLARESDALATRVASQEALLLRAPSLAILVPRPDREPEIIIVGSHPQGIEGVQVTAGEARVSFTGSGEPFQVFSYTLPSLLDPGPYTVTALITATNQLTATDTATFRVPAGAEGGDEEGRLFPLPEQRQVTVIGRHAEGVKQFGAQTVGLLGFARP